MFSTFRWHVSGATLLQLSAELAWLCIVAMLAVYVHGTPVPKSLAPALMFAVLLVLMNGAFGLYRRDHKLELPTYLWRLFLAMLVGAPLVYIAAELVPGGSEFQRYLLQLLVLGFCGLVLVRQVVVFAVLRALHPHRVLVLGTGREAAAIESSFEKLEPSGHQLVGFYPLDKVEENIVSAKLVVDGRCPLDELVRGLGVGEIIVAVRQQRGGVLPLRGLLECRLAGVQITDLARYYEAIEGQIRIDSLKASWLIYGNGFRQGWWRSSVKRCFDIIVASVLLVVALPVFLAVALLIRMEGGPIIYRQQRVGLGGKPFTLLKFRSMRPDAEKDGKAEWAVVGDNRVTWFGRAIRRSRIDELPQLLNVLKGEMSFVGPRPERPVFVAMLTEKIPFYSIRHSVKPGITGWAQVRYTYGATVEQSVKKLEYDLYYVKNHTLLLDILILLETVRVVLLGEGAR